jgi:hypothetical protein
MPPKIWASGAGVRQTHLRVFQAVEGNYTAAAHPAKTH